MRGVVIRAKHGWEPLAGALVQHAKKLCIWSAGMPIPQKADPPSIRQHKGGDIDRVSVRVLAAFASNGASGPAHITAGVGAKGFDANDLALQIQAGGWTHGILNPCREVGGERAGHGPEIRDGRADFQQLDRVDGGAAPAAILIREGLETDARCFQACGAHAEGLAVGEGAGLRRGLCLRPCGWAFPRVVHARSKARDQSKSDDLCAKFDGPHPCHAHTYSQSC